MWCVVLDGLFLVALGSWRDGREVGGDWWHVIWNAGVGLWGLSLIGKSGM